MGTSLVNSGSGIFRSFLLTWWLGSYKSFSFNYLFDSLIQTEKRGCPMAIILLVWGSWAIFRASWDGTNTKHKAYAVSYYAATFLGRFFNVRIFLTQEKAFKSLTIVCWAAWGHYHHFYWTYHHATPPFPYPIPMHNNCLTLLLLFWYWYQTGRLHHHQIGIIKSSSSSKSSNHCHPQHQNFTTFFSVGESRPSHRSLFHCSKMFLISFFRQILVYLIYLGSRKDWEEGNPWRVRVKDFLPESRPLRWFVSPENLRDRAGALVYLLTV